MIRLHAESGQRNPALTAETNLGPVILASIVAMPLTASSFGPADAAAVLLLTVTIVAAMFCIRGYFKLMVDVFST